VLLKKSIEIMRPLKRYYFILSLFYLLPFISFGQETYAEKLGYPKGAKVIILHVDDLGMSIDSNLGAIKALEQGISTSGSLMMPCPCVPGFVAHMKQHPGLDVGLHLTLTSEWDYYRWGPVLGQGGAPSLCDSEGKMYKSVEEVVSKSDPADVDKEIRAQLALARSMGVEPTHLDSHMGTLFAKPEFLDSYIKLGIGNGIPVMFPGGHNTEIMKSNPLVKMMGDQLKTLGLKLWDAGLPVLDDLYNSSYDWVIPENAKTNEAALQEFKTQQYINALNEIKPGITMIIMHCTDPSPVFSYISDSGITRKGDMLAMIDPMLKQYIENKGIILTTWRELMERRKKIK
jgi:hypothetical protein